MGDALVVRAPAAALQAYVPRYCGFAEHTGRPARQREPLSTSVVLIFGLDTSITVVQGAGAQRFRSLVGGLDEACAVIEHDGTMRGVQVDLSPLAARMLFGVPMHELARTTVAVEDVLGRAGQQLEEALTEAGTWDERFALLDAALAGRFASASAPPADVQHAWRRLRETDGRLRVDELARELRCSRKHLAARFREHVGVPPKLVARIHRFRRASDLLERSSGSIAEVAFTCGYADESHLDRDFRAFAATTPAAWRADPRAVTFVQDGAVPPP
jgi:AraC-like DNA-binding protein